MEFRSKGIVPHEFVRVRIGGNPYLFRTLSWIQLLTADREIRALSRAVFSVKGKAAAEVTDTEAAAIIPHLEKLISIVCPELLLENDQCDAEGCNESGPHADYLHMQDTERPLSQLMKFYYARHDWKKLTDFMAAGDQMEKQMSPDEAADTVSALGRMVSEFQNIGRLEFNDLRFEEAIDLIKRTEREWDEAKGAEGKLRVKDFLARTAALGVGDIGESQPLNFAPGFFEMFSKPEN